MCSCRSRSPGEQRTSDPRIQYLPTLLSILLVGFPAGLRGCSLMLAWPSFWGLVSSFPQPRLASRSSWRRICGAGTLSSCWACYVLLLRRLSRLLYPSSPARVFHDHLHLKIALRYSSTLAQEGEFRCLSEAWIHRKGGKEFW